MFANNPKSAGNWLLVALCALAVAYPLAYMPWTFRAAATKHLVLELFVCGALAARLVQLAGERRFTWRFSPLDVPLALFLLFSVFSTAQSPYPVVSWSALRQMLFLGGLYILARDALRTPEHVRRFLGFIVLGAVLSAIIGLLAFSPVDSLWTGKEWSFRRIQGTFQHPNVFGLYLVATLLLLGAVVRQSRSRRLAAMVLLPSIGISLSRGAWLGLLAGLLTLGMVTWRHKGPAQDTPTAAGGKNDGVGRPDRARTSARWAAAIAALAMLAGFVLIAGWSLLTQFEKDRLISWSHGSNARRPHIYRADLEMIKERPMFGFGLGTFEVSFQEYRPAELSAMMPDNTVVIDHAHNDLLEVMIELGFFGMLAYLFVWGTWSWFTATSLRERDMPAGQHRLLAACLAAAVAIIVHNMFNVDSRYLTIQALTVFLFSSWPALLPERTDYGQVVLSVKEKGAGLPWAARVIAVLLIVPLGVAGMGTVSRFASSVFLEKAHKLIESGPWAEMEHYARRSIQLNPSDPQAHYELGYALFRQERWLPAVEAYAEVKAINPNWGNVDFNIANCHAFLGNWRKVRLSAERAIRLNPATPWPHFLLGKACLALEHPDEALGHLEKYLESDRDNVEALWYVSNIWRLRGDEGKADQIVTKITQIDPDFADRIGLKDAKR